MMNKTVKELRVLAKELNIKGYYKMVKEDLVKAIELAQELSNNIEQQTIDTADKSDSFTVKEFDTKKYETFKLDRQYRIEPVTSGQRNLIKSLENNYEITLNITKMNRGQVSDLINETYKAINNGSVKKRSTDEIVANVKAYKPVDSNMPTDKQLAKITALEHELNITVNRVIKTKLDAHNAIQELLAYKNKQVVREVAITSTEDINTSDLSSNVEEVIEKIEQHREDKDFLSKLGQYFKRIFSK